MIEVNLIPDVKKDLIQAQKVRTIVTSISIIVTIVAVSVTVVLGVFVFGAQKVLKDNANKTITEENQKLQSVPDLSKILTLQNQASVISQTHASKAITSRIFETLAATNPASPNSVKVSTVTIDTTNGQVSIDAQAYGGYHALETYKKTLEATKLIYSSEENPEPETVNLVSDITFDNVGYGKDSEGKKVLSFTVNFTYAQQLFDPASENLKVGDLKYTNVTDSYVNVPESLFTTKADQIQEEK